jgi:large subunit ribosomal protein L35
LIFKKVKFLHFLLYQSPLGGQFLRFFNMQKTKKSIAKRFKVTGTGKLLRRTPGHRHLLRNKSVKQRRRAGASKLVADGQRANLIRGLPFS